jgi:hypothetical protein
VSLASGCGSRGIGRGDAVTAESATWGIARTSPGHHLRSGPDGCVPEVHGLVSRGGAGDGWQGAGGEQLPRVRCQRVPGAIRQVGARRTGARRVLRHDAGPDEHRPIGPGGVVARARRRRIEARHGCPYISRRVVPSAVAERLVRPGLAVVGSPAPDDHLCSRPHSRMISAGRQCAVGDRPPRPGYRIDGYSIRQISGGAQSTPDDHLPPGPDGGVLRPRGQAGLER